MAKKKSDPVEATTETTEESVEEAVADQTETSIPEPKIDLQPPPAIHQEPFFLALSGIPNKQ